MTELTNWLMVFLRASAMLSIFPIFSATNFPVQLRLALGALLSALVSATLPDPPPLAPDTLGVIGQMAGEVAIGLVFGFASKMIFYTLEIAGAIIGIEIGLSMPAGLLPMMDQASTATSGILYYLAAMLWLALDMHHWMLIAFQKTYVYLPIGGAHFSKLLMTDMVSRTSGMFVIALQLAAPLMAVSFIIMLVFAALGRAVPQMNVFSESLALRPLVGLSVFGLCLQLTSQHIINYLRRLPEDMLHVAQILRAGA
ncbi:MAG TPA: flagellar biosynthetic protein FliR [Verrucomicrobiae bacterium]|jgi:flagellar biosynthetic protein FliR|nr:flagellar biosynthetic protein FliR [Verrucomicrobiae bacterium]